METEHGREAYDGVLGAYIRGQRQLADLSLRQLSAMTNVSNAYLSQIERGLHQPSVKVLRSIGTALNLSAEAMLAQAGLIDHEHDSPAHAGGTEAAIMTDTELTDAEKKVLVGLYRQFRQKA